MFAAGLTDVGKTRSQNQDAIYFSLGPVGPLPNLFIVADGIGGHNAGEVASTQAIATAIGYISNFQVAEFVTPDDYLDLLVTAVQKANDKVCEMAESNEEMQGMGTTFTACVVDGEKLLIAHVGDSRIYAFTPAGINQLTTDHTYVNHMLQTGQITAEEAQNHPQRNMITRSLGSQNLFEVDGLVTDINDIITVLICSDGLTDMLDDKAIHGIVSGAGFVESRTKFLVEEANLRGGNDNISVILIDIKR